MVGGSYTRVQQLDAEGKIDFESVDCPPPSAFHGKSVLITGGSSGLGEACVRMFAQGGAYVVIGDLDVQRGTALQNELGDHVKFIQVDVTSYHSQLLLFASALDFFPSKELDILLTFAGTRSQDWSMTAESDGPEVLSRYARAYTDQSHESTDHCSEPPDTQIKQPSTMCMDVALYGTFYSVHIALKFAMNLTAPTTAQSPTARKSIILVSSTAGYRFLPGRPDYTASKFGIRGLFRTLRASLASSSFSSTSQSQPGIRINMLAPYFIPTPMTQPLVEGLQKAGVKLARIDDLVKAVQVLAGSSTANGRAIAVTGEGCRDLCDDLGGLDGAEAMGDLIREGWLGAGESATLPR